MRRSSPEHLVTIFSLLLAVLTPVPTTTISTKPNTVGPSGSQTQIFLPLIRKSCPNTISGIANYQGWGFSNLPLRLRFFDGSSWSTIASTTTSVAGSGLPVGSYTFSNLPSLAPGQKYYVLYYNGWPDPNSTINQLVHLWATREITSFGDTGCVDLGNFDIANTPQDRPFPGQIVTLPAPFDWSLYQRQSTLISDTYELDLYDPVDLNPYFQTGPLSFPIGMTGVYTFTTLPAGFVTGTWYAWEIWIYSVDGGLGLSSSPAWDIAFANNGLSIYNRLPQLLGLPADQQLIFTNRYLEQVEMVKRDR